AEDLVAEHQRQIERFARDNDVGARAATVAEVNAVVNAVEWPLIRKTAASSYGIVAAFLPALFFLVPFGRGLTSSRETALMVCLLAGCYAFVRWLIHGPFLRRNPLRTHTEEISGQPNDVAEG